MPVEPLPDTHKLLIQECMKKAVLDEPAVQELARKCFLVVHGPGAYNPEEFNQIIATINNALEKVDMKLERGRHPNDGRRFYALINLRADEASKYATEYTNAEIIFFKKLVELLVNSTDESFEILKINAINAGENCTPKTKPKEAGVLVERFKDDGWLDDRDEHWVLGVRAAMELQFYLRQEFPDRTKICDACQEVLLHDVVWCSTVGCKFSVHKHCERTYMAQLVRKVCPQCRQSWDAQSPENNARPRFEGTENQNDDDDKEQEDEVADCQVTLRELSRHPPSTKTRRVYWEDDGDLAPVRKRHVPQANSEEAMENQDESEDQVAKRRRMKGKAPARDG
ncbi:hypothetical protein SeLEV6574_g01610 [Synchytrium endobioticum]|nr:hypothetical protein SeLEV6574_g01610 [Synchytrium endobioticum]